MCQLLVISFSFRFHENGQKVAPHNEYYFNALTEQIAQMLREVSLYCPSACAQVLSTSWTARGETISKQRSATDQQARIHYLCNSRTDHHCLTKRDGLQHHTVCATMPREMVFSIIQSVPPCQERWTSASFGWFYHMESNH
jgi:hypothetical protein